MDIVAGSPQSASRGLGRENDLTLLTRFFLFYQGARRPLRPPTGHGRAAAATGPPLALT